MENSQFSESLQIKKYFPQYNQKNRSNSLQINPINLTKNFNSFQESLQESTMSTKTDQTSFLNENSIASKRGRPKSETKV